jgi:hypothetical protein
MKTSSKLVFAAVILLVLALIAYDSLLKTEYLSGKYKDIYRDYKTLNFKDFDAADLPSSTASNVKFIQGPFSVRIDPEALRYSSVKQKGNRLRVEANFNSNYENNSFDYLLIISCPKLTEVNVSAFYRKYKGTQTYIDTTVKDDWHMRQVLIEGFNEDSISVKQNYGSTIELSGNHFRALKAVIGTSDSSGSKLIIRNNNQIKQANISVLNRATLMLDGKPIQNLNYQLADSAKMIFTGDAQNMINNSKPHQK